MPSGDGTKPVNLAAAPMTHTAGLLSLPCTAQGGTVVILTKPDPALLVQAIVKHRVTEFFLPPTVIYALLDAPGIEKVDFSSVRYLLYGAAPMSVEKLKRAIALWGPIMCGGYGQSEALGSISNLRPDEHFDGGVLASDERLSSAAAEAALEEAGQRSWRARKPVLDAVAAQIILQHFLDSIHNAKA